MRESIFMNTISLLTCTRDAIIEDNDIKQPFPKVVQP